MTDFRKSEKLLKHHLKKKKNVTLALIVAFLISGVPFFEEEISARDLRVRNKENNSVRTESGGPTLNESANGTQVVEIVKANENGISHNKFIDLSVGAGNGLIFNNSTEHGVSQIGGYVTKNTNLDKSASVILNEVTGNRISNINGSVEVFGQRADFILANENGINVNGATFINTNGVTLSTGKVSVEGSSINFDVQKGNIKLNGVGTSGDYFNILAKTIEIHKEISPIEGEKNPDISLIAGENILHGKKDNLKNIEVVSAKNSTSDKYGIYATELGAMYGNNIRLISTDKGLGVRHEGAIFSKEDIEISSNGDIAVRSLNSGKNLIITGDNLKTLDGAVTAGDSKYIANISAEKDIEFKINDSVKLQSGVQSVSGNIKITAKDLTLVDKTSARIIGKSSVVINLSNKFDVQGVMIPSINGVDSSNLIIVIDTDGTLGAKDITTGKVYSSKDITWVSTGIFGENVEIFTKELENSGVISANKTLKIDADKITNNYKGLFKGADLNIRAKSLFVNKGDIRENQKDLNEFVDPNGKLKIEVTLGGFENYGNISSKSIDILTQKLINSLNGKIMATDGNIIITTTVGELINHGEIFTDKNLTLLSNENIVNTGKIAGNDLVIEALKGNFLNAGYISSVNNLKIIAESLTNAGSKEEIKKYLEIYSQYSQSELQKVEDILTSLEGKEEFKEIYDHFKELRATLLALKEEISKTGNLGVIEGSSISVTTSGNTKNTGMVISQNDINIEAKNIENQGIVQGNGNIFLKAVEQIINDGRLTGQKDISITAQSYTSLGNTNTLSAYFSCLQKVDMKKLEELKNEISTLESQLSREIDKNKAKDLINRLNLLKNQKNKIEEAKNILSTFENLGIVEGENIVITTIDSLTNNGVIISQENINLTSQGNIKNSGIVSVGKDATVKGKSFENNSLTVSGDLIVETIEGMTSNDLTVGKNISISGGITSNGKLHGNGNLNISGDFSSGINSESSIVGDITISGGVNSSGDISTGGSLTVNGNSDFISSGELQVGKDLSISSKNIKTNTTTIGGSANIISQGNIVNKGDFQAKENIIFDGNNISSNGNLATEGSLTVNGSGSFSSEQISVGGKLDISSQSFINNKSIIVGQDTVINSGNGSVSTGESFHTQGKTQINGDKIDINGELISNGIELNGKLNNSGNIQSKGDIIISSKENIDINSGGKIVATGDINIDTTGDITNKGMIVGNQDINLEAKNINNTDGSTIWANKNIILEASEKIYNGILSTIQSMGDISLKAKEIENNAGTINSKGKMDIKTNSLINKSNVIEDIKIDGYTNASAVTRWDQVAFYHLDYVYVEVPNIIDNSYVKDRATISSGGDLTITGYDESSKTNVLNHAGTIASSKNIEIVGNVTNTSHKKDISVEWLLENTKVTLYWETKLYGGAHGNSGVKYRGNLKEALMIGVLSKNDDKFYKSLTQINNPTLEKALSTYLGANWKSLEKPVSQDKWNKNANFQYVTANASGKILAGKNLTHSGGSFINDGGESGSNQNVSVDIGNDSVDGIVSNGNINIKDINQIKEVDGVKQIHDVEIITGEITINGVTIKAETGNIAGSIAVAGTINPIIFIETPTNSNGMFKPATPKPDGLQPIYETNIEFIDPNNFYGSDYFFKQIGYDKNKTSSVIGDAYYEYILLTKMIQEGIGYTGDISAENIKTLLDNALNIQEELKLEVGKPLTPDQISKLDKDIVWYVEMEVNGQRTLVPQIYFSNDSRVNIAQNQGNGGSSTVKVGGNFITDNTEFSNTNGNIVANGNIIIKSEGDITNNSSGGVSGGIISQMGNVAVDAGGDVNLIGGSISGDNVLVSGNNVNIEATLGTDENGNQIISDQGKISAESGIQIDAKNDVNIKGGSLTASGVEVKPEEQENSMGGGIEESKSEEEIKVKDVKYYEELFKKDSADIIEGDAGTININANGNINIEDIYTVSSNREQNNINDFNHNESISAQAKSNGSTIIGSNVNISSEKDINIKGSTIATNDVLEENKDKELVPGSVNISSKNDVNITDSKDITYEKSNSVTTTVDKGLITVKWSDSEKSSSLSKGLSIITGGDFNISSDNNIKIQGSDITSLGDTNIEAKNDIEIVDGRDVITEKSTNGRYQVIGGGVTTSDIYSSKSVGSNITTVGDLNISSGNNIKIVNGNLTSTGDTKLKAENDISIEAGKNEYVEKTNSTNVGIYVDANAGIGGVGVSGNASTSDMSATGEVSSEWGAESQVSENLDGSNENVPTTSGKPHMDQLINSEIGLKLENIRKETTETTWSESQIQGENISIEAGNTVDIGGGDYKANEDITIKGKTVNTTKYEDSKTEKTDGFTFTVKQSQGVNSAVADTINTGVKMDSAIKAGNANEGVLAAQGIGAASNIIFNDLVGVFSKQSIGVSVDKSTTTETSENITSVEGKNINIIATDGDINLAGVDIKGEENITLDAKKNINVTSAKKTSTENGVKVDLEAQLEQTAGYSALWGGNTDIGVGGSVNVDVTQKESETFINSTISSNGNLTIKSGSDTNIIGAEIEAKKDANIDVGGNLNIESKKSSYDEHSINANAGANVSIGGSTNTIGKAEVGFNAGGGDIWKSGETVEQSGIKVGGNLNVSVKGDLNMTGGVLGSESGNGSLEVGGNLNIKDIVTKEQQGGAHITVSGGFSGDMGVDGTIGDEKNKQVTTKSAIRLNPDNIKVDGNVSINGESSNIDNINTDINNTQTVDYDIIKKGGDITLSGSVSNINDVKDLVNKVKNKISSGSNSSDSGSIKSSSGDRDSIKNNGDVDINNKVNKDDKYSVLDKDNAFDFPKDDGIRDSFVDRANEPTIVPETSPKLDAEPPAYKEPPSYKSSIAKKDSSIKKDITDNSEVNLQDRIENTIKDIGNLKDDISRVEKIESITGGDLGTKAVIEDLNSKLSKSQEDLNNLIKNVDKDNSLILDKVAEGIEKNIEGLLDKQKEIADKATITDRDKDNLERIENQLKQNVDQLNGIIAKKDSDPRNEIAKKSETILSNPVTIGHSSSEVLNPNVLGKDKIVDNSKYDILDSNNTFDFKLDGATTDESSTENRLNEIESKIDSLQQKLTQSQEDLSQEQSDKLQKELEDKKQQYEKELNEAIEAYDDIENDQLWKNENDSTIDELKGALTKNSSDSKIQELLTQQKEIADKKNLSKKAKDKLNKIESELKSELGKLNNEAIENLKKEFIKQKEDALLTLDKAIESGSKYDILDKDNAFDFLDDNGIKDSFKDKAQEEKIVAEHFEALNTQPQSSNEILTISGVTKDETNLDKYVNKLSQENIEKNISKDREFETLYNNLASNEEKFQKEREKLQAIFEKQAEIVAKDLTQKDKKELAKLEKDMSYITENINKLQKEQQETVDKILDKERKPNKKMKTQKSIKDKITDFFTKKDKVKLDKKEYEKTENGFVRKEAEINVFDFPQIGEKVKNNNNLESDIKSDRLGDAPLVYGTRDGRRGIVDVGERSPNTKPIVADGYIGKLNLGYENIQLTEFADKYAQGKLTPEDIDKLSAFREPALDNSGSYTQRQINKASFEANKELLTELLKNKKATDALETIHELRDKVRKDPEAYEKYNQAIMGFFTEKTKTVLEKTMERDGQIYFSLDNIVTDRGGNIDFDRLLEVYNPKSKNYNSVTSAELRLVFDKYLDNPNMKYLLWKQTIEIPKEVKDKIVGLAKENERFAILEKDNAFDFPKDDGVRDSFEDRANEPKIVAEHYEPLGTPPVRNNEEIKLSKYVNSEDFQQRIEGWKEQILEKYGADRKEELDNF